MTNNENLHCHGLMDLKIIDPSTLIADEKFWAWNKCADNR